MTEPVTPEPVTPPVEPVAPTPELTPEALRAALEDARRDAAKYRTKARELEPLAAKAQQLEDAQKSEAQRLQDQLAAVQTERDRHASEALRYRVANLHGIRAEDTDLLGSGTEEEITARAARLAALYSKTPGGPPTPGRPVEQLSPGAAPKEELSEEDATWQRLFGAPTGK